MFNFFKKKAGMSASKELICKNCSHAIGKVVKHIGSFDSEHHARNVVYGYRHMIMNAPHQIDEWDLLGAKITKTTPEELVSRYARGTYSDKCKVKGCRCSKPAPS